VERIFSPPTQSDQEMWRGSGSELAQRLLSKLSDLRFVGGMRHD
jgi:electron transfer flavoprotein beta subunit